MPIGPARMPLFDHLGELRMRLVRIVACLGRRRRACSTWHRIRIVRLPHLAHLPTSCKCNTDGQGLLTTLDPFEGFSRALQGVAVGVASWHAAPVILWQILAFFLPALKPSERKWFIPTFAAAVGLFIFGTVFCYLIILNPAFQWLVDQSAGFAIAQARASTFVDMIVKFEIGFGFAFELPLIVFYLVIFDVVPYKKLRGSWRTVYVALMVISAMATPDASPVTMLLMFAAMVALYEGSLLISRIVLAKRIKKQNADAWNAKRPRNGAT